MTAAVSITNSTIGYNHTCGIFLGDEWTGGTVAGNLIYRNLNYPAADTRNALHINATNAGFASASIVNNTIADNYGNAGTYITGTNETIAYRNNIHYNNGREGTFRGDLWLPDADISGLTESNNLFFRGSVAWESARVIENNATTWDKDHIVGAEAGFWQFDKTSGANNIVADPLFINASGGNLHLKATSPALHAGSDGNNIGAYQDRVSSFSGSGGVQ